MTVTKTQPQVRVIKTRGRGREALIEIEGRQLVVTDSFSPPGNAAARDVTLSRARLFGTAHASRSDINDVFRVNPDHITKIVQRGVGLWLAHGRIESVIPFEMNCGPVRLIVVNVKDERQCIHGYMTVVLNRLELYGRLDAELDDLPLPGLPARTESEPDVEQTLSLEPAVELESLVTRERAEEREVNPPIAPETPDDDGFDVQKHYTMRQLLTLMTAATVVLGVLRLLPPSLGASLVGMVVLATMFFATDQRTAPAIVRLAWWMLLAIYVISVAVTMRGML